ncbi:hypothetical protein TrLO_g7896 [Triparma laevis f. longispina]|uniref:Uncharacterized protein n=1 Tax=Triparma laevis f. longispina TaxID=1714387 RepID=A0A9W7L136_9STRA|nr:hypothetical protein TrLO_g7896 [Triparma laevis f. longispina]
MISDYLLLWFLTKLVDGSVRSEWQNELTLSIEKIARMRAISLRPSRVNCEASTAGIVGVLVSDGLGERSQRTFTTSTIENGAVVFTIV